MKKRFLGTIAALAIAALVVSAVPAFTAENGTITVTVTAQASVAPCLTVGPGDVGFGTLPFSADNSLGLSQSSQEITVNFCGTAPGQNLYGATTPATGPSGSWAPTAYDGSIHPCPALNQFYLWLFGFTTPALYMTGTSAPVLQSPGGSPAVFPLGNKVFQLGIYMPCQGSNGAGEAKSITATFTAAVAP